MVEIKDEIHLSRDTKLSELSLEGWWYVKECGTLITLARVVVGAKTNADVLCLKNGLWVYWEGVRTAMPVILSAQPDFDAVSLDELISYWWVSTRQNTPRHAVFTTTAIEFKENRAYLQLGTLNSNTGVQVRIHVGESLKFYSAKFLEAVGRFDTYQVHAKDNELVFIVDKVLTTPRLEYRALEGVFIAVLPDKEVLLERLTTRRAGVSVDVTTTLRDIREKYESLINEWE